MANRIQFTFEINDAGKVKVDGLTKSFVSLDNAINKVNVDLKKQRDALASSNRGLQNTISDAGLAGATLTELGRAISDSNYGIRGMANNFSQLSTLFITLVSKRGGGIGGVTLALRQLGKQLLGPLGIILAFQSIIALLEKFAIQADAANAAAKGLKETFSANRKLVLALARNTLKYQISNKALREETERLAESSKEFAQGLENLGDLNDDSVRGLIGKYVELLELEDKRADLLQQENVDTFELAKITDRILQLKKLFAKTQKDVNIDVGEELSLTEQITKARSELVKTLSEPEVEFDPDSVQVLDDLDVFFDEIAREMPNLQEVIFGLSATDRERALRDLENQFGDAIKTTEAFRTAQIALNKRFDDIERQNKLNHLAVMLKNVGTFFQQMAVLNEGNKDLAKASIIANSAAASVSVWASYHALEAQPKGFLATAGAVAAQAAIIAQTVNALKSVETSTPLGGGRSGSTSSASSSQAPIFNVVGQSGVSAGQLGKTIAAARSEPMKAYVVANDITNAQELENKIIQQSSLG